MLKTIVLTTCAILLLGVIYLASDIKDAYKLLPMKAEPTLEVSPFADWREFEAKAGKFKVFLPVVPQYIKEAVAIPNTDLKRRYEMYIAQEPNDTIFMINLITYPNEIDTKDVRQTLHDLVDEMKASKPDNKLVEIKDNTYQDYPAVDFTLANPEFEVKGKAFMIDKMVFVLDYISRKENFALEKYDFFMNSFKLEPKTQK